MAARVPMPQLLVLVAATATSTDTTHSSPRVGVVGVITVGPETLLVSPKVTKVHVDRLVRGQYEPEDAEEEEDD
ncbi:hypothetical protein GGR53DRAFT_464480 [Hypoxylon sp. FL1150]|nr:hypothetical protein GGR53DRAFT_464480 [Hypoxylon sp. FL1150]